MAENSSSACPFSGSYNISSAGSAWIMSRSELHTGSNRVIEEVDQHQPGESSSTSKCSTFMQVQLLIFCILKNCVPLMFTETGNLINSFKHTNPFWKVSKMQHLWYWTDFQLGKRKIILDSVQKEKVILIFSINMWKGYENVVKNILFHCRLAAPIPTV